jgi:predicted secreted protein
LSKLAQVIRKIIEKGIPALNKFGVKEQISTDIETLGPEAIEDLAWTKAGGALFFAPVSEDKISGVVGSGKVRFVGFGDQPYQALALSMKRNDLVEPLPKNLSQKLSFYIWYDAHQGDWSTIPDPISRDLQRKAIILFNEKALLEELADSKGETAWRSSLARLKEKAITSVERARFAEMEQNLEDTKRQFRRIDANLQEALTRAQKSADFASRLRRIGAVISIANLISEAAAIYPDKADELARITDKDTLLKKVDEYRLEKDGYILKYREEFEVLKKNHNRSIDDLRNALSEKNASPAVQRELDESKLP